MKHLQRFCCHRSFVVFVLQTGELYPNRRHKFGWIFPLGTFCLAIFVYAPRTKRTAKGTLQTFIVFNHLLMLPSFLFTSCGWSMVCVLSFSFPYKAAILFFCLNTLFNGNLPVTRRGYFPKETNCAIALLRLYSDQHHHFQLGRLGSLGWHRVRCARFGCRIRFGTTTWFT